jgi:pyrimidine deaminase RibD-like protein
LEQIFGVSETQNCILFSTSEKKLSKSPNQNVDTAHTEVNTFENFKNANFVGSAIDILTLDPFNQTYRTESLTNELISVGVC